MTLFKKLIKAKSVYFIIGAIVCFYAINNFIWLRQNTFPGGPDEACHLTLSLRCFKVIDATIKSVAPNFSTFTTGHWPPFYHISSAILNLWLGSSYIASAMVNILYFIILLFSLYFIGAKLFDKNVGILAALFISLYPMIFRYSRFFGPDFALTAMICLSVCLLLYTEYFRDKIFSVLFGISLALGMLTKWTFILFLIGPLTYTLLQMFFLKAGQISIKNSFLNFIRAIVLGILLSLFWYLPAFDIVTKRIELFLKHRAFYNPAINGGELKPAQYLPQLDKFLDYLRILINEQVSLLFFAIFLLAIVFYFIKRRNKLFLILWYAIPYFFLSLSTHKEGRFMLPSLPVIALISAAGLQSIGSKKWKNFLCFTIIILGLFQFIDITYNSNREGKAFSFQMPLLGTIHTLYSPIAEHNRWFCGAPEKKDWKMSKVANSIARCYKYNRYFPGASYSLFIGVIGEDTVVRTIYNTPYIIEYYLEKETNLNLRYGYVFSLLSNLDILEATVSLEKTDCIIYISKNNSWPEFDDLKEEYNILLSRWKNKLPTIKNLNTRPVPIYEINDLFIEKANNKLKDFVLNKENRFKLVEGIKLPDGYVAYIYAKDNPLQVLKNNSLCVSFLNGRAFLLYKDKNLTPSGIETSFRCKGKEYSSLATPSWQVKKTDDYTLEAAGSWKDLPGLTQIWTFKLVNDHEVSCKVGFESAQALTIGDVRMGVPVINSYRSFITPNKDRNFFYFFPWIFKRYIFYATSLSYVGLKQEGALPGLLFYGQQEDLSHQLFLHDVRQKNMSYHRIDSTNYFSSSVTLPAGSHTLKDFRIGVFMDDASGWSDRIKKFTDKSSIQGNDLRISFQNGGVNLSYKDESIGRIKK